MTLFKGVFLAATIVFSGLSLPAMATECGKCQRVTAMLPYPLEATPEAVEKLRIASGAARVRVEKPGVMYTADYREDRIRVFVDENNMVSGYSCG